MVVLSAEMINLPTVPVILTSHQWTRIPDQLDQAEGEHGEIHALQPQGQGADEVGQNEARSSADEDDHRQGKVRAEEGRGIYTRPEKGRRRERDVAGGTRKDCPAQRQDHVHQDVRDEDDRVSDGRIAGSATNNSSSTIRMTGEEPFSPLGFSS